MTCSRQKKFRDQQGNQKKTWSTIKVPQISKIQMKKLKDSYRCQSKPHAFKKRIKEFKIKEKK